ncbi:MAG TPA: glycosyl hydrolase-related protein, partial [Rubrobacter sp.]|nr:glycosyl hydrolase-related protein [Rubrobacter sp.]
HFTYSLFPHPGDWTESGVVKEAFALNSPLISVPGKADGSHIPESGLLSLDGVEVALGSLKMAEEENGVILRLYEPHGARGECVLSFAHGVESAERVSLLEETEGTVEVREGKVRLEVRPFEVVTLRLRLTTE